MSIAVTGVLKSPTMIVLLLISPLKVVSSCPIYCDEPMLGVWILKIAISPSFFVFSRAAHTAYGGSQARGQIGAVAAGLYHSHSNAGSLTH